MKPLAKPLTLSLLSLVALAALFRDRLAPTFAADSESVTWGANDPAWSPDGTRLAFSLFGSVWQVPAAGGEAQQLSTSSGYHAHPAWSPKGDKIAFIDGSPPAGPIPNISGRLKIVDVANGEEREIALPDQTAGNPAWSPAGDRIACSVRTFFGSVLQEVALDGGAARPIHDRAGGGWNSLAWNPRHNEVFFTGNRGNAAQVWSMPPGAPPILIQMPLTRYRGDEIVQLQNVAALADGSGVIYAADPINGKGDFDLYRVDRQGGAPVRITDTVRDEFSPAVSPDGKLIAHVSNHIGNIDLFTMPVAGGEKKHVRLSGLKFRQPSGRVRVRALDQSGAPTPVRLYVRASDGKAYCPPGNQIFYWQLDPGQGRQGFFISSGDDAFPVPAGEARLVAQKGVEYEIGEQTVRVAAGQTAEVTFHMKRWTNWSQRGWYTGENHFHANYNGIYYQRPPQSLRWLEAEDLNAANMIVANNAGAFVHDKEFFRGGVDPLSTPRHLLYWGQEYRNSDPLGHMAFLNIKKQVPPSYSSVPGSDSPHDFPLNTMAALEARQQGGLVSYVHPIGGATRDVFDTGLGAKESPVGAALDALDSIDLLPFGPAAYELWYRLLNCGFRIAPGAGTDVFTNWRGINSIPGGARQYVEVGPSFTWNTWIARYREGRNFVTNGPLLTFTVDGQPMGSEIRVPAGKPHAARLVVEIESRLPLRSVEFIHNGAVVESAEIPASARTFRLEQQVPIERSGWFAARVAGHPARGVTGPGMLPRAHSGAIYVTVGGSPILVREDVELMIRWIDRLWQILETRNNLGPGENKARARAMIQRAREHYQAKLTRLSQPRP